jgi:hypothetical protein
MCAEALGVNCPKCGKSSGDDWKQCRGSCPMGGKTLKVEPLFISGCLEAIAIMRAAGISNAEIACVLQDVRASAIREERLRIDSVLSANPPIHPVWTEFSKAVADIKGDRPEIPPCPNAHLGECGRCIC